MPTPHHAAAASIQRITSRALAGALLLALVNQAHALRVFTEEPGIGCGEWSLPFAQGGAPAKVDPAEGGVAHIYTVRAFVAFRDAADAPVTLCLGGESLGGPGTGVGAWLRSGEAWTSVVLSPASASIVALLAMSDDRDGERLIAAGSFQTIDGVPAAHIAQLDDGIWQPLAAGLPAAPTALAALPAAGPGGETALLAAGPFAAVSGSHVLRFDGRAWIPLGDLSGEVQDLAIIDHGDGVHRVYAGGWMLEAGGTSLGLIAMWDGSSWSALPPPPSRSMGRESLGGAVLALAAGEGSLAGTLFVGLSVATDALRAWDGAAWTLPGGGILGGPITMLASADDGLGEGPVLFAYGAIDAAGGVQTDDLARWNGRFWNAVGAGGWDTGETGGMVASAGAFVGALPGTLIGPEGVLFGTGGQSPVYGAFHLPSAIRLHQPCPDPRPGPFGRCDYAIESPPFDQPVDVWSWNADGSGTGAFHNINGSIPLDRWIRHNGTTTVVSKMLHPLSVNASGLVVGLINNPLVVYAGGRRSWSLELNDGSQSVWGSDAVNSGYGAFRVFDDGRIFGNDENPATGATAGYRRIDGASTLFEAPAAGPVEVDLNDANSAGVAVGGRWEAGVNTPWHLVDDTVTPLPLPPTYISGWANAIAESGMITGLIRTSTSSNMSNRGARWNGDVIDVLEPLPGHDWCVAWDIADSGVAVGKSLRGSRERPVIWDPAKGDVALLLGRRVDWRLSHSFGPTGTINDQGWIVVHGDDFPTYGAILVPQTPPPGDIDGDCVANLTDLMLLLTEFGRTDGPADLDGDGAVDGFDLGIVLANWQ